MFGFEEQLWVTISKLTITLLIGTLGIIFFAIFFREPPRVITEGKSEKK